MEKKAMAVREKQWLKTITAAKQSSQTIKVQCAEHGVPVSSFYKWQRNKSHLLYAWDRTACQELHWSCSLVVANLDSAFSLFAVWSPLFGESISKFTGSGCCWFQDCAP